mmetsp:Transcript_114145/g.327941  ORF Transcript_114145/g.327941 Transcript_114145/m.327941 type:complete len:218 (+) Transcript_114145:236-889(+)
MQCRQGRQLHMGSMLNPCGPRLCFKTRKQLMCEGAVRAFFRHASEQAPKSAGVPIDGGVPKPNKLGPIRPGFKASPSGGVRPTGGAKPPCHPLPTCLPLAQRSAAEFVAIAAEVSSSGEVGGHLLPGAGSKLPERTPPPASKLRRPHSRGGGSLLKRWLAPEPCSCGLRRSSECCRCCLCWCSSCPCCSCTSSTCCGCWCWCCCFCCCCRCWCCCCG